MTLKPVYCKIGLAAAILVLTLYFFLILFGANGLSELNRKHQQLAAIQAENRRLEKENRLLYRQVSRLKNDPAYLEHVIRTQLSLVSEEQIVFKFDSDH